MTVLKRNLLTFVLILLLIIPTFAAEKPILILISLDGFRWDYPDRGLTPSLNALAGNGVRALSLKPSFPSKTFPNHLSIITGLWPEHHGIILNSFLNPFTGKKYDYGESDAQSNAVWYTGETIWETAHRQGMKTAAYFWPGSNIDAPYRAPTIEMPYKHNTPYVERVRGVLNWLRLPEEQRPQFITLYFHETDDSGHDYGPDSAETDSAIAMLDRYIGMLQRGLADLGLKEQVNQIVVSDHGMIAVPDSHMINIEKILRGEKCVFLNSSPLIFVYPQESGVYTDLKNSASHFKVYLKKNIPSYLEFSENPLIAPIVLIADPGYIFVTSKSYREKLKKPERGTHGYENYLINMHGIFIASGPAFRKGLRTGTLRNIDIYPLMCKILGLQPAGNIDGDLNQIKFVLKEE